MNKITQIDSRKPKTTSILDDYEISNTVLGLGINGKVVQCNSRKTKQKYALKVVKYFCFIISKWLIALINRLLFYCLGVT